MSPLRSGRAVRYAGASCPRCAHPLDQGSLGPGLRTCSSCHGAFEATPFDPPPSSVIVQSVAQSGPGGVAACTRHPANAVVANCARCGVFMCALCRIRADDMALCPPCFERLSDEGVLKSTQVAFRDYLRLGSTAALLGVLICYLAPVTGPTAIYCGIRGLGQMKAMNESEGRWKAWVIFLVAIAQMAVATWVFVSLFSLRQG